MALTDRIDTQLGARHMAQQPLTPARLDRQASAFRNRGGISQENRGHGFTPAFLDTDTGAVYPARFADGRLAAMHVLDGLPDALVLSRRPSGAVAAIKASVIPGFLRQGQFFTRHQATQALHRTPDTTLPQ